MLTLKRRPFSELHGVATHKTLLLIATAVRTSDSIWILCFMQVHKMSVGEKVDNSQFIKK
jgi:hypothetical protein